LKKPIYLRVFPGKLTKAAKSALRRLIVAKDLDAEPKLTVMSVKPETEKSESA